MPVSHKVKALAEKNGGEFLERGGEMDDWTQLESGDDFFS